MVGVHIVISVLVVYDVYMYMGPTASSSVICGTHVCEVKQQQPPPCAVTHQSTSCHVDM